MRKKTVLILLSLILLLSIACEKKEDIVGPEKKERGLPRDLTLGEVKLISADNKFGFSLFSEVVTQEPETNIFLSPLSVSMALGMTYNGANSTTEEAMKQTLKFGDMTDEEINQSYKSLIELLLNLDPEVQMELANSIWSRLGFPVEEDFINLNKEYFDAEVTVLDFSSAEAVPTINAWVSDKTHGKITEIIDTIPWQTVMYLINALYFKGTWSYEFEKSATKDDNFYLPDGSLKTCKMMSMEESFRYYSTETFQAVELPYGCGDFAMTIFLPSTDTGIDNFISGLNENNWDAWLSGFHVRDVNLYMPKFKLEYKIELKNVLSSLGMEIAFDPNQADFTGINPGGELFISKVKHKTYVDVNEEGTEAAAVTAVEIQLTAAPGEPVTMRINRPFFFVIRETNSGAILFMGKIIDPVL